MAPKANPPRQPLSNDGVEGIVGSSLQRKQGNVVRGRGQYAVECRAKEVYYIVRIKLVGLREDEVILLVDNCFCSCEDDGLLLVLKQLFTAPKR